MTCARTVKRLNSGTGRLHAVPLLLLAIDLVGCGATDRELSQVAGAFNDRTPTIHALDPGQRAWVDNTLASLSVPEMAGQVVVAWIPGSYVSSDSEAFDEALKLVDRGVGGLWMMGGLPHARAAKANALQRRSKIPLLVLGSGLGTQLYGAPRDTWMLGGGTDIPSAMAYGAIGDPAAVLEAGRIAGLEARATGANLLNDGGGANVLTNLANVLHNRTYGDDPRRVGQLSAAFTEGVHDAGILNYVGFFPGAGSLGADPHVELPISKHDAGTFRDLDFVPFRSAIGVGVDVVMTSHFAVPGLTGSDSLPATMSPEVIRLLREELGFDGAVLTDDLSMGAISNSYDNREEAVDRAVEAFLAGHDLLLGVFEIETADRLSGLVESGEIPRRRLEDSVRRVLQLKARLRLHEERTVALEKVAGIVGRREHQQTADRAADRSIVLLRDRRSLVPLQNPSELSVLSVVLEREENDTAGDTFHEALRPFVNRLRSVRLTPSSGPDAYVGLQEKTKDVDRVVVSIYLRPQIYADPIELPGAFVEAVRQLQEQEGEVIMISFGKLTVLDRLANLETFMLAWSEQPVMQRAAARALLGAAPIAGRLPVALPPHHETGDGLDRRGR